MAELFINHRVEHSPGQGALAENFHVPCVYERVWGREREMVRGGASPQAANRTDLQPPTRAPARRGEDTHLLALGSRASAEPLWPRAWGLLGIP